jgi:hypothetical protein
MRFKCRLRFVETLFHAMMHEKGGQSKGVALVELSGTVILCGHGDRSILETHAIAS